jgi:hypothetical protein
VLTRNAEDIVAELPCFEGFLKVKDKVKIEVTDEEKQLCDLPSEIRSRSISFREKAVADIEGARTPAGTEGA